ncbi:putative transposase [Burkholderia aenigmatica]|uniref:Putative transposase n=1 Tax=Burkholderia aenigmatica TaxID=2015348 RepID=A0A6P2HY07_9BURK|nr:putative transposase [Burkholderia aenigmatica]
MAHARRKSHDLHAVRPNDVTEEALRRICVLYKIEEQIRGKSHLMNDLACTRREWCRCLTT